MSDNREIARQLMLAMRREHGGRELANVLAEAGLPSGFAEMTEAQEAGVIKALTARLSPAAVAHAKRMAFAATAPEVHDEADDDDLDDAELGTHAPAAPSASAPKSLGDIVGPAYSKWNSPKRS